MGTAGSFPCGFVTGCSTRFSRAMAKVSIKKNNNETKVVNSTKLKIKIIFGNQMNCGQT